MFLKFYIKQTYRQIHTLVNLLTICYFCKFYQNVHCFSIVFEFFYFITISFDFFKTEFLD